jgi:hypothetical protein
MKLHFSNCGRYLHVAAFEGQCRPQNTESRNGKSPPVKQPVKLALLVFTYRLSVSKTSRSPPILIHRIRVEAGKRSSISASTIPFTVTWRPQDVYISCSSNRLTVYRISLFKEGSKKCSQDMMACPVMTLHKPLLLPGTATQRPVYYFPPFTADKPAAVILGGETCPKRKAGTVIDEQSVWQSRQSLCTITSQPMQIPVGCLVHEGELGGWVKSDPNNVEGDDRGIGKLDRRLVRFDYEADCDCESLSSWTCNC